MVPNIRRATTEPLCFDGELVFGENVVMGYHAVGSASINVLYA